MAARVRRRPGRWLWPALDWTLSVGACRPRIGYLPQEPVPVGFLSATENVALALHARGCARVAATRDARAALTPVGLGRALRPTGGASVGRRGAARTRNRRGAEHGDD